MQIGLWPPNFQLGGGLVDLRSQTYIFTYKFSLQGILTPPGIGQRHKKMVEDYHDVTDSPKPLSGA